MDIKTVNYLFRKNNHLFVMSHFKSPEFRDELNNIPTYKMWGIVVFFQISHFEI